MGPQGRHVVDHHRDLPGEQVVQRRARALVRDVDHGGAGELVEPFAGQVRRAAVARRAEADFGRLGLGVGDELGHRLRRDLRVDRHQVGLLDQQGHRPQVLGRVVGHLGVEARVDTVGPAAAISSV